MQLGMIGLGRMGANMVRRLLRAKHEVVVHDRHADAVQAVVADGAHAATTLQDFVARLAPPRAVWLMVPAGIVERFPAPETLRARPAQPRDISRGRPGDRAHRRSVQLRTSRSARHQRGCRK